MAAQEYYKFNYYDLATLDATSVSFDVNFANTDTNRIILGGLGGYGIHIYGSENGKIEMVYNSASGIIKPIVSLDPKVLGVDALTGRDVGIRIAFDIFSKTNEKADVKFSVYVNGTLYENREVLVTDLKLNELCRTCCISVINGPFAIKSSRACDLSVFGFSKNWKQELGLK